MATDAPRLPGSYNSCPKKEQDHVSAVVDIKPRKGFLLLLLGSPAPFWTNHCAQPLVRGAGAGEGPEELPKLERGTSQKGKLPSRQKSNILPL